MDEGGTRGKGGHRGGGRVKVYLHAVTDDQADLLTDAEISLELQELITRTGADIAFDDNPSPVPGMKIIIIRGVPSQIEAAVKIICLITADEKTSLSSQAQAFWIQWVESAYPDLHSRAYFLPPVYFNRVPMTTQAVAGQNRLVLQSVHKQFGTHTTLDKQFRTLLTSSNTYKMSNQESSNLNEPASVLPVVDPTPIPQPSSVQECDLRDDVAMQRVLFCLQKLSEKTGEIFVGISQFHFGQYLGNPCYAPAAAQLPSPINLPSSFPRNWRQGDFDILIIHRHYGFVVFEVKAVGDNLNELDVTKEGIENNIRKKLKDAMRQLDKAEAMLSHLVSDIAPGLRITKTIAVPNLTTLQVQQAVSEDLQLAQDLCKCLGTTEATNISDLCLCSDQLSDPSTPWEVSTMVLEKLEDWWKHNVSVYEHDSHMTSDLYKIVVARFCGPATTVTVPCTSPPRLSVKTLGQAVSATGEVYTAVITLFPEQVDLLNRATPRLFVTGPPGTGKTVVLLLMATEWLRYGHDVYIVTSCRESRAACRMLYQLLQQTLNTLITQMTAGITPGQLYLRQFSENLDEDVERIVNDLSQVAEEGSLYVIADEVGGNFKTFCDKLLRQVPRLHLWAASCFHGYAPADWEVESLTRPLRSPPAVIRKVEHDYFITEGHVREYSHRGVPDHTDGPPVKYLYHRGQGHSSKRQVDCEMCGHEVANFLHSLRVGVTDVVATTSTTANSTSKGTAPPCLQWRDVLVLYGGDIKYKPLMITVLEDRGVPVRMMTADDIDDVATASSDVVWMADGDRVRGLERKVVVCLESGHFFLSLNLMSRCTSQLVIVSTRPKTS